MEQEDVTEQTSWPDITDEHKEEQKMLVSIALYSTAHQMQACNLASTADTAACTL